MTVNPRRRTQFATLLFAARLTGLLAVGLGALGLATLAPPVLAADLAAPLPAAIVHRLKIGPELPINGAFRVSVMRGGKWVAAGETRHTTVPAAKTLLLADLTPGAPVRVRIATQGPGGAQLDAVLLDGQAPIKAKGAALKKLARADLDVANSHGRTIELTFAPAAAAATLTLHGRIEPKVLPTTPLGYPARNTGRAMSAKSGFYKYTLGSAPGRIAVDGEMRQEDLGNPFFQDRQPVDPGHPRGTTYGWVHDDGTTLYVAIDFTPDNTYDGAADWFKVYAKVGDALREFTLSVPEQRWGKVGFSYTERVAYQHKVYEFAIPLAELGLADAKPGTVLPLAFAGYGTVAQGTTTAVSLAYDPVHNQYLAAYEQTDFELPPYWQIWAQRLDIAGAPVGDPIEVRNEIGIDHLDPDVAFDPQSGKFLVVWIDDVGTSPQVWGRFVGADGSTPDAEFAIDTVGTSEIPRLANDAVNGKFLAVWGDGTDVLGRLITAADANVGPLFDIASDGTSNKYIPDVAWEPANARYLVVWTDDRDGNENIYGQLISADGSLFDPDGAGVGSDLTDPAVNFIIADSPSNAADFAPAVAAVADAYYVAWSSPLSNTDVLGQLLDADGGLLSAATVSSEINLQVGVAAASALLVEQTVSGTFISADTIRVAWEDERAAPVEIYATEISLLDATPVGEVLAIPTDTFSHSDPVIAASMYCGNAVTAALEFTGPIYELVIAATPACAPTAYSLLSFTPGVAHGLTAGGTAGVAATFQVRWWGAALPTSAQLWLDLDKDGTPGTTATHGAAGGPFDGGGWAGLAGLAALLTLLLAAWTRRRTVLAGALALGLLAGGLAACSGGGGSTTPPAACPTECLTMTETDPADTNPVDGKLYSVTVTIPTAGSYAYRFVFTAVSGSTVGVPVAGGTLTVP